jgi:hypothetical protein
LAGLSRLALSFSGACFFGGVFNIRFRTSSREFSGGLVMEARAFEAPLSDKELQELGRPVVNCGAVEFLLTIHVGKLFAIDGKTRMDLIAPLTTRRKIKIIAARLAEIPGESVRTLVDEACKITSPAI